MSEHPQPRDIANPVGPSESSASGATVNTGGTRPVIRLERHLPGTPESVWAAITDRQELKSWFPTEVITDEWRAGATLRFVFPHGEAPEMTGTVLEYDPPRRLAYSWGEEVLRFALTPRPGGGTTLVLTDELDGPIAARNAAGWDVCLDLLAGHKTDWQPLFESYSAAFEPALGPQQGPPTPA